jgi:hypothetical protein
LVYIALIDAMGWMWYRVAADLKMSITTIKGEIDHL